jgi:hypothetical protein
MGVHISRHLQATIIQPRQWMHGQQDKIAHAIVTPDPEILQRAYELTSYQQFAEPRVMATPFHISPLTPHQSYHAVIMKSMEIYRMICCDHHTKRNHECTYIVPVSFVDI